MTAIPSGGSHNRPTCQTRRAARILHPDDLAPARRITGLVYVAAFALDEGESALDITGRFPGSQLMAALRLATALGVDADPAVELYLDRKAYPRVFAADLPGRSAMAAAAAQRPTTAAAFAEKLNCRSST